MKSMDIDSNTMTQTRETIIYLFEEEEKKNDQDNEVIKFECVCI